MPYAYTALFLIPLGGALVFIAAHRGPETLDAPLLGARGRDRSLDEPGAELAATGDGPPAGAQWRPRTHGRALGLMCLVG